MGLRRALAVLILTSAVLFAVGAAIERSNHHKESSSETVASGETGGETHGESGGESGGETHAKVETHKESSEDIFGINPEAKGLVAAAVAAGIVLAAAVWLTDSPLVLFAVIVFGLVFAVFDVREVVHQANESRAGLVVIASLLAVIHLAVAGAAGALLAGARRPGPATTGA